VSNISKSFPPISFVDYRRFLVLQSLMVWNTSFGISLLATPAF